MCSFYKFLEEVNKNTKIPFLVKYDGKIEFSTINPKINYKKENISTYINIKGRRIEITTLNEYKNCISLLSYLIKDKLSSLIVSKEDMIKSIFNGEKTYNEAIMNHIYFSKKNLFVINIFIKEELSLGEELIKASYEESDIICTIIDNNIILIGNFEDIEDHINGIKESIISNLYNNCYISYSKASNLDELIEAFNKNKVNISIGIKYDLQKNIYREDELLFESIIDNVNDDFKNKIYKKFEPVLKNLDSEFMRTIDVFLGCGTNLSEASKKLYIHRNTLIYRLDKIYKNTSFDLRDFNDANVFKIAYLIWKEKNLEEKYE